MAEYRNTNIARQPLKKIALGSSQLQWQNAGSITVAQAALTGANRLYSAVTELAATKIVLLEEFHPAISLLQLRFRTNAADNDATYALSIYASRTGTDVFEPVVSYTTEAGQAVDADGLRFLQTLAEVDSSNFWLTDKVQVQGSGTDTDGIASVWIDMMGYSKLLVIATAIPSSKTLYVDYSGVS